MPTIVTGKDSEVKFGPGMPTIIIGERINPTGRKRLATHLQSGDLGMVEEEARTQKLAGAEILDVNVGVSGVEETKILPQAVKIALASTGLPICIDSADTEAIQAALSIYPYKALVNSVTGEDKSLDAILPLVKKYDSSIIGLTIDEKGIPNSASARVEIAEKIVNRAESYGISHENVVIDCLALAASADTKSALVTLETIRIVTKELSLSTTMGASNISFGMPQRKIINHAFLSMAIEAGLSAAIVDPTQEALVYTVLSCNFLTDKDEFATRFLTSHRAKMV